MLKLYDSSKHHTISRTFARYKATQNHYYEKDPVPVSNPGYVTDNEL